MIETDCLHYYECSRAKVYMVELGSCNYYGIRDVLECDPLIITGTYDEVTEWVDFTINEYLKGER